MAKLHRFLKLNDRFDSQVFTFVLPTKAALEQNHESYTKDFIYGHHKWSAIFVKSDLHLGAFLKLQSVTQGMKCQVDFSFTLLNREHYTRNESFIEKGRIFTSDDNQHGRKPFVGLSDLVHRNFMQDSGEYLIELELRKINCTFECYIRLPKEHNSRFSYDSRLESSYFSFGLFDWSISLYPNEGNLEQEESVALQLHRHTSFDHICNVRYYIGLGENGAFDSEEIEQLVDVAGNGDVYVINASLYKLTRGRSTLKVKVTMMSVVSVSEVTLDIASRSKNKSHCYDRDKQAWMLQSDISSKSLAFKLYYTDITHVPRKYSRYVCWNIVLLTRYLPDKPVKTHFGPYSRYFVQQDLDDGYCFSTGIPLDQFYDTNSPYMDPEDPRITVHIEWVESHLLACPTYHAFDDIDKLQKHQMWREILALQSENYVLEKQLHSYQLTLSKGTTSNSGQKLQRDDSSDRERERRRTSPSPLVRNDRIDPEKRAERRGERTYRYK